MENFNRFFELYCSRLRSEEREDFCIDGSSVLAVYGIRDARDLDFLSHQERIDFGIDQVNCHNEELPHYPVIRDEIIYNPAYHFYYRGCKFVSLELTEAMKNRRDEEKDRTDVKLIEACCKKSQMMGLEQRALAKQAAASPKEANTQSSRIRRNEAFWRQVEKDSFHVDSEITVSVIIPCYNQAPFLVEAAESIVAQTFTDWECIIVNDGSSDNTSQVARDLILRHPDRNIRLIEKSNGGLSDARNKGISEAKGDWILPLDSDDVFDPSFLDKAFAAIKEDNSINLVFANMKEFGVKNGSWIPPDYSPEVVANVCTFVYASLYKKELWERVGGYFRGIPWGAEDWNFWISCSRVGIRPYRIPEKLFHYRTHAGTSMYDVMMTHWEEVKAFIRTLHEDIYSVAQLLHDHNTIANCCEETVSLLDSKIIPKHGDVWQVHFWKGLILAKRDSCQDAVKNFNIAVSRMSGWQPLFCMAKCQLALGLFSEYQDNVDRLNFIWPELLPILRKFEKELATQKINLKSHKPLTIALVASVGGIDPVESCGGLETAMRETARALALRGHRVALIGYLKCAPGRYNDVEYLSLDAWKNGNYPAFSQDANVLAFASGPDLKSYLHVGKQTVRIVLFHHQVLKFLQADNPSIILNEIADAVICVSQAVRKNLLRDGITADRLFVAHNGYDPNVFYPCAVPRVSQRIIFAGALVPAKNPIRLIEAFLRISPHLPDAELHICGAASLWGVQEHINWEAVKGLSSKIFFHGVLSHEELALQYSQSVLCVIPSKFESFSLVSLEAQACGCVPLVANVGGVPETITPGITGFMYEPDEVDSLEKALLRLLPNEKLLKDVSNNAVRLVSSKFSWDKTAKEYETVFNDMLARRAPIVSDTKEQKPTVTVVIPCYNYAHYLPDALISVIEQTYQNFEIIIVNDGSTDNTIEVANKFISDYPHHRISLINQPNSGQPAAPRNRGIAEALGEYILPLDPDDKISPSFLEKAVKILDDNSGVGVAYCHLKHFGTADSIWHYSDVSLERLAKGNILPYCSMYRRSIWEDIGGYHLNVKGYEDWDFWISVFERGWQGMLIPEPLFWYRKHGVSLVTDANSNHQYLYAQIILNHPHLYDAATRQKAERILESIQPELYQGVSPHESAPSVPTAHNVTNRDLLALIPPDSRSIVEIGCKLGSLANAFRAAHPAAEYVGIDVSPDYVNVAEKYCTRAIAGDIEKIEEAVFESLFPSDCWVFDECLEHLQDPWSVLRRIRGRIDPGGCLLVCIHNAQHWSVQMRLATGRFNYEDSGLLDRTHLRWFTRITMIEMFQATGWKIEQGISRNHNEPQQEQMLEAIAAMAKVGGFDPALAAQDAKPYQYVFKVVPV